VAAAKSRTAKANHSDTNLGSNKAVVVHHDATITVRVTKLLAATTFLKIHRLHQRLKRLGSRQSLSRHQWFPIRKPLSQSELLKFAATNL
jgi:hypothetical protein